MPKITSAPDLKPPKEWERLRLGDVVALKNGERSKIDEVGVVPIYGANGILDHTTDCLVNNDFTIIIGRVGASGEIHLAQEKIWVSDNAIYSETYKKNKVNLLFLFYLLKFKDLRRFATKTTHPLITQSFLNSFELTIPPLPEQRKIAEVLRTIDTAIQKADSAIAKTGRLKRGLMQRLLTRGIGHKKFKESKVGRIPFEWAAPKLSEVGTVVTGKTPPTSDKTYWNGDIPFITPVEIQADKYVHRTGRQLTLKGVTQAGRILPKDTVSVVCIGSTIGKLALTYGESITNQQINSVICNKEIAEPHYVYYAISFRVDSLKTYSGVAAVPIIKKSLFEQFEIPLPPLTEQQKIAGILGAVDEKLGLGRRRREKLERVKKGLMDDLLTGRKRVAT